MPWPGPHRAPRCRPFSRLVPLALSKLSPATNALVRSTFVPTLVRAGVATNVVPMHSELTFDMRLLPGDDGDTATAHVVRALRSTGVRLVNGAGESVPRTGPWWDVLCEAAGRARAQLSAAGGLPSGLMQVRDGSSCLCGTTQAVDRPCSAAGVGVRARVVIVLY